MVDYIKSDKGKNLYWVIGILTTIIFLIFLIPSLFDLVINKIYPVVFGMPYVVFMQALLWIILWLLMVCLYWVQRLRGEL